MYHLIAFIIDVTDQLFNDIFQRNHTLCAAVLIDNNCQVGFGVLHIPENIADTLGFRDVNHVLDNVGKGMVLAADQTEEILVGDHADNVVHILFIDGKPGKMIVQKQLLCICNGGIRRECHNLDTGNQNLTHRGFIKLER